MENEYRRGYDLPLTEKKWMFWLALAAMSLMIFNIERSLLDMGGELAWIMRLFYPLMFLVVAQEFINCFGRLHLVYEGIAITIFGRTLRQFPREEIRFLGGVRYSHKGNVHEWICVCDRFLEEKYLRRYAGSLRRQLGFHRRDILLIEWSPERLDKLMQMYPQAPWCDLSDKKKLDAERGV